ncbi:quinol monooxygenase YgiN [Dyadobacter jejuensis]|uniref:Quinol monooxygenase YgiN n=1 Tax=Dyadobacter jejuensis TaxID=1082580 RepID=A0A316ASG4_9BACT|nr:putative quinol monooxygenase [Dyadobacter jejuensis]PWJ60194.1 quinol monooxygenase YgiN [Dyadobacter jejuensis]
MTKAQPLTIVAKIYAKEQTKDLVKAELIKLIAPTKAEEGCLCYDLHQDLENPCFFLFYETWSTRELWQQHMNSEHSANFGKATEGALASVAIHEMSQVV